MIRIFGLLFVLSITVAGCTIPSTRTVLQQPKPYYPQPITEVTQNYQPAVVGLVIFFILAGLFLLWKWDTEDND